MSARQLVHNSSTMSSNKQQLRYRLETPANYAQPLSKNGMNVSLMNHKPLINKLYHSATNLPLSSHHQHPTVFHASSGLKQQKYVLSSPCETPTGTANTTLVHGVPPIVDLNATIPREITKMPHWWLTLPCLLTIMILTTTDSLFMNDFIVTRYEQYYHLNSSKSSERIACLALKKITTTPSHFNNYRYSVQQGTTATYNMVLTAAAKLNIIISAVATIPSLISFILLGSNCDIIGRKPLIIIPFIGKVLRYALMLIIVQKNLADVWIILVSVIDGLFGTAGLVIVSSFAYVTDCTTLKNRTKVFVIAEVAISVSTRSITGIIALIFIGYLLFMERRTDTKLVVISVIKY
ncbi:unnamed protein product [Didymodactylos carnosus]|uniref:Uncharacterized protein n=1 Tax=Didymodactylos carnosus TaxID=1234261 RepID=A0A8S2GSB0_9BILA|nr:unnamed protein product [Didymodactylos carnosus]CAF3555476.1 unnamed protein product [Didymodactylos carnosus]